MLRTVLKWTLAIIILPLLFSYWSISLTVSVNENQEKLDDTVKLIGHINRLENRIIALGTRIHSDENDTPVPNDQWQRLYEVYQRELTACKDSIPPGIDIGKSLAEIEAAVEKMASIRESLVNVESASVETYQQEAIYFANAIRATHTTKSIIQDAQKKLASLSGSFSSDWEQLNILVLIFCLLVIGLAVLLKMYQRDINLLNQVKKSLRLAYDEMDQKVKERTAGLTQKNISLQEEITERMRIESALENSLSLHRATLESTADGILAIDKGGKVVSFNRKFAVMWDMPEAVISSETVEPVWEFILDKLDDPDEMLRKISELYTQSDIESYDELPINDGRIFDLYSHPQWIGGETVGRVWSFRDITERRKWEKALQESEERLREHKEHLEELVAERTVKLENTNSQLRDEIQERILIQNELKESREMLRSLSAYLESAREEERIRIARELHDELGQSLSMLRVELDSLEQQVPAECGTVVVERTQSMSDMVGETIQKTREICQKLRPSVLDDLGFAAALDWQMEEFEKRTGIKCKLLVKSEDVNLSKDSANALFRVFQEALTNVLRHSKATKVASVLEEKNGELWLKIQDNGEGIQKTTLSDPKSLGLLGMNERIHFLKGTLKINSKPGEGTAVIINVPINEQVKADGQRINH